MPTVAEVNAVYQDSIAELQTILETPGTSSSQRKATEAALRDILLLHGAHVIQEIDGRTALLSGLIAELNEVSNTIQLNPVGDALDNRPPKMAESIESVNSGIGGQPRTRNRYLKPAAVVAQTLTMYREARIVVASDKRSGGRRYSQNAAGVLPVRGKSR
ncbi:MAG: hypothetical protein JWO68_4059 [Actinomycetia bacterium]|jgi:DNA-binding transcriptional MerR regulator|nr:hypothetical protein [Actinomycetes bacterium]